MTTRPPTVFSYLLGVLLISWLALPSFGQESLESQLAPLPIPGAPTEEQAEEAKLPIELLEHSHYLPGFPGWIPVLTALILLVPAALLIWFFAKNFKEKLPSHSKQNHLIEAQRKLSLLRESSPETPLSSIASQISLIIRGYLAHSKSDPSLYQTREEFIQDSQHLTHLSEPVKAKTEDLLEELASLQYAPQKWDQEFLNQTLDRASDNLNAISHSNNLTTDSPSLEPSQAPALTEPKEEKTSTVTHD